MRHSVLNLYKRCLPYLARLSENSVLAASIGFCIGVLLTGKAVTDFMGHSTTTWTEF